MSKIIFLFIFLLTSLTANEKVILQLKWLHQFQFAGYYAALEKGFYKDVGLDVEIRERDLNKDNIQQVVDGEADYSVADSALFLSKAKNEPVVIVAPIFQHSPGVIMTLKSSGLDSPYTLKNKNLLFYKKDVDGFGIFAMLKSLDIKPSMTRFKDRTNYLDLASKKVDAYPGYLTNEPFYFKKMGVEINIINPANYGFDLYGDMLFTSTKEAKEHSTRVEKFKEATLKGWEYALEHKEEIAKLIKSKYAKEKTIEHLMFEANALEQLIQQKATPLGTIDRGRIEYTLDMYKKYGFVDNKIPIEEYIFNPLKKQEIENSFLTKEEQAYLQNKIVIRMCIDPDWMPLEGKEKGKHTGMSSDYFSLFQDAIGVPIEMVDTKNWGDSLSYAKQRKCDILSTVIPTNERSSYLDFSKPYFAISLVIATNVTQPFMDDVASVTNKQIGIVKGYAQGEILRAKYPSMQLVYVSSIEEGLKKVKEGELFGFADTLATVGYSIQKDYIGQLKIAGKFNDVLEFGIGVRNDEPLLTEIFNKAIEQIPLSKRQEILNRWISVNYDRGTNYTVVMTWVGGVALVFSLILAVVMYVNRKMSLEIENRKLVEKRLEEMSVTDELTSLYNRRYFNEILPKLINSAKRETTTICFAILDIDYFKQYNDTYGHLAGDEVLKSLAASMRHSMQRADDYCFRLGGEEFGVLFKGLSQDEAKAFIDNMKENIENLHIKHESSKASQYVTASFGLVVKDAYSVKSENELYKEADKLLYEAKEGGRNRVVANA